MRTMRPGPTAALAATLAIFAACASRVPLHPALPEAPRPAPLTWEALREAEYLAELPASGRARLVDGAYSEPVAPGSANEVAVSLGPWHAFGDLDGDGVEDAAVVLIESGGGSGSFFDLAAVAARPEGPVHVAGAFLGDRVKIDSLSIEAGVIVVRLKAHRSGDPLCCPSSDTILRFLLDGHSLVRLGAATVPG